MQIDVLVTFIFSVFLLTITPGPDIIYVFFKSISDGKRSAIELSLGLTSGLLFHTLLVIFGISAILSSDDFYYDIIKYLVDNKCPGWKHTDIVNKKNLI